MTQETKEALEVLLANRNYLYALLHKLFGRDPDEALLAVLEAPATGEAFTLLSDSPEDLMGKAARFLANLAEDEKDPAFIEALKEEYTRLFVGPAKLVAPPWESVYRGKEGMLFQESTLEVRRFYKSYGLKTAASYSIADDSLALELDFMAHLAQRAQDALAREDEKEMKTYLEGAKRFLEEHLLVWVPKFLERMKDSASQLLYPQMCLVLEDYLRRDCDFLAEALGTLS